jgi:hypothetical protein
MPLVDVLKLFWWTFISAIKILIAIPRLYISLLKTKRRIRRINDSAEEANWHEKMKEKESKPSDKVGQPPVAAPAEKDPRMWGDYDDRMDQLARNWIFPLAVLN